MYLKYTCSLKVLMLLLVSHAVAAQSIRTSYGNPFLRHVQGLHGIEVNAGITAMGKSLAMDWSYYFFPCWQIKAGLGAEVDKFKDNAYRNIFTQPVVAYTLFTNHRNLFFNILGGTKLHLERYRLKKKKEKEYDRNFNIGLVLGGEIELFLMRRFEVLLSGGSRIFLLQSPYGMLDYFLTLGFRISF
ncbi:MAG TPA: hypothetical protein DCQ08_02395 [Amoebophilaceae bacterium]|nr:hypothetical protein [Amoebophilaceae bacterium]